MSFSKLPFGELEAFNVVIEVPAGSQQRYEHDEESGALKLIQTLYHGVTYPFNYGFVPQTESGDGAPLDAFVMSTFPISRGAVAVCRTVGMIELIDRGKKDNKILAIPTHDKPLERIQDLKDLPVEYIPDFEEFFQHLAAQWQREIQLLGFHDREIAKKELLRTQISIDD